MAKPREARRKANPCIRAALAYAELGWSVIPLRPGEKRPLISWFEFQGRRASPEEIRHWFAEWPDANVGIVTGAVSGLLVVDVDPGHGGWDSLKDWQSWFGGLPETVAAQTGGGGRHHYFRHPGGQVRSRVGLAAGIDLRGDGGMVVAPPSLHPSGGRYAWLPNAGPKHREVAALPPWLRRLIGRQDRPRGHPEQHWRELAHQGVEEGRRNDAIASLTGHLLWREVDPEVITELLLCWNRVRCRPPLDDHEVVRTVESIMRTHERGHAIPPTDGTDDGG